MAINISCLWHEEQPGDLKPCDAGRRRRGRSWFASSSRLSRELSWALTRPILHHVTRGLNLSARQTIVKPATIQDPTRSLSADFSILLRLRESLIPARLSNRRPLSRRWYNPSVGERRRRGRSGSRRRSRGSIPHLCQALALRCRVR